MKAIAEAPAKAIITGEHFVVHGAWALAAALPMRVRVTAAHSASFRVVSNKFRRSDASWLHPVGSLVEAMGHEFGFKPNISVSIESQVPESAGLGSSAATMVALTSALSRLHSLGLGPLELARLAMVGEGEIHGRPSGIDPTICSVGGAILFKSGHPPKRVRLAAKRTLIVSHSGVRRSTKGQISRVALTREKYPSLFAGLTDSASEVSEEAADRLAAGDMKGLGRLLSFNHAVLSTLGVSNEPLDALVDLCISLGSYGAKLTGAGGGGSVVAVAPKAKEKSITSGLRAHGFEAFRADLPVKGVSSWLER